MNKKFGFVALSFLLFICSANAEVTYRWNGQPSNPTGPAQSIIFEMTFSDAVVESGSFSSTGAQTSCNFIFPCSTYLSDGLVRLFFSIDHMNPTIDTSQLLAYNHYDLNIRFHPNFLSGSIFAGNFGGEFGMESDGNLFTIIRIGSDAHPHGPIVSANSVRGKLERVSIPEPSTMPLLILALSICATVRRYSRSKSEASALVPHPQI